MNFWSWKEIKHRALLWPPLRDEQRFLVKALVCVVWFLWVMGRVMQWQ